MDVITKGLSACIFSIVSIMVRYFRVYKWNNKLRLAILLCYIWLLYQIGNESTSQKNASSEDSYAKIWQKYLNEVCDMFFHN